MRTPFFTHNSRAGFNVVLCDCMSINGLKKSMKFKLINPRHYFHEFKQLTKFVITPVGSLDNDLTTGQKVAGTWAMFVVKMTLAIFFGVLIGVFYDPENLTTISMAERFTPPVLLFVTIFALPLLEETAFRLSLKFKPIYLALSLGVIGYYIASKAIYHAKLSDIHDNFEVRVIVMLTIMVLGYPLFSIPKIKTALELFWANNFRWLLYFFCLGFAWMHIFNYELTFEHLLLMPIITLPKLVNGVHMCTNSLGFAVSMLSWSD